MVDKVSQDNPTSQPVPAKGESDKAEKYVTQLCTLIDQDKIQVSRTDLSRYDSTAFQDHYRVDVKDYQIEISHTMTTESTNSYVMLFTNLKNVAEGTCEKVILAYVYLNEQQYRRFKEVADDKITREQRRLEEQRFTQALSGFDQALQEVSSGNAITAEAEPVAESINQSTEKKTDEIAHTTPNTATDQSPFSMRPAQA